MDGFSSAFASHFKYFGDVEIRFARRRGPKQISFIGLGYVERCAINVGKDGHRGDAHFAAGAHHAYCDFATIRNEDLFEHRRNPDCRTAISC